MAALKYTFDQWWSINGRTEWDNTMAKAAWNAAIESVEALKPSHNKQSTPFRHTCESCGEILPVQALFCHKCGMKL